MISPSARKISPETAKSAKNFPDHADFFPLGSENVPQNVPRLLVFNPEFVARVREKRRQLALKTEPVTIDRPMPPWVKEIIAECCRRHGVDLEQVLAPRKRGAVRVCKCEILWRVRSNETFQPSYPLIGRWFDMSHKAVIQAVNDYEREAQAA